MIARELHHLAGCCEQWATAPGTRPLDQFTLLGLAAQLANLADRAAALEQPGGIRLIDLPDSVADLAAFRRTRPHTPSNGDTAA